MENGYGLTIKDYDIVIDDYYYHTKTFIMN